MSRANVEVLRAQYEAFTSGDLERTIEFWDPDGEWRPAMAGGVEDRIYRGQEDLRRYWNDLFASFSEVRVEDLEFRDLGDRVLVLYILRVRGGDSGLTMDQPAGAVYELRNGKLFRGRSYLERRQALDAAGLRA